MPLERKKRALRLLDEALERPPQDRPAFLDGACGDDPALRRQVESLLETDADGGILREPAFSVHAEDAAIGRTIDNYKLVRLLDRGGMGTVYLAEREDFEKRVALKLIRRGLDLDEVLVRRFHNERQILARLEHPNVARLLDGGTTVDRLPYFVMEYVEGEPIDRFCEARGLSVEERLELFREVCSAVHFAHQNLVIHRDLKPGNVLITADGTPKLLDFGIAKLLDDGLAARAVETETGLALMTPRYASPEQIRLEPITTASDVYALGVMLYELLTGLDPYDVDTARRDEVARAICEREPDKPSTAVRKRAAARTADPRHLRRRLSGDLDGIVLKAMRKEPKERYGSVEQLSEDVRRHLAGLPVAARVGSFAYHAGKFVRRNKLALVVAAAFLLLSVTSSVVSTVLWRKAVRERQSAETAFRFLEGFFRSADPDQAKGKELTARELIERGKERIEAELKDEPELRIDLAGTLADVFFRLGDANQSRELMELSLQFATEHYGADHPEVAKRLTNLAAALHKEQNYPEAEKRTREALRMMLRLDQLDTEIVRIKSNLATTLLLQDKLEEAEELYLEVLNLRLNRYGPDDLDVATSRRNLSALHYAKGEYEKATVELREALEIRRRAHESEHTKVASVLNLLGNVLADWSEVDEVERIEGEAARMRDEAERMYDEALAIRTKLLKADHSDLATTKVNLAGLLARQAPETAHVLLTHASTSLPSDGWEAAEAEGVLGLVQGELGCSEDAEFWLVESHAKLAEKRGPNNFRTRKARDRIVEFYQARDRMIELKRFLERWPEAGR
jgi:serine/threonine-protein kinase